MANFSRPRKEQKMPEPEEYIRDKRFILETLDRHESDLTKLFEADGNKSQDIAVLKVKAGIWGLLGGLVPAAIALAVWIIQQAVK